MKGFKRWMGVALVALALVATACGGGQQGDNKGQAQGQAGQPQAPAASGPTTTFRYYTSANPTSFDPAMVSDVATMTAIIGNVYSGLVYFDNKGAVIPDMAEKIEVSPDGKTYTFTLKDAKFHNGRKVTAEDFKFSMLRAINPKLKSPVADSYLDDIAGIAKYLEKRAAALKDLKEKKIDETEADKRITAAYEEMKKDPGITAKDEKTLVIQIDAPKPFFLAKMTYPTAWVVDKTLVKEDTPIASTPENVKLAVGTGPFKFEKYEDKSKIVLKRFADFYGEKAKVGTVELGVIEKDAPALAAYRAGDIDMVGVAPADYKAIKAGPEAKEMIEWPTARVNYIAMNQAKVEAFKDQRVRQAFNYAVDKQKMVDVVFEGMHFPAYGVLPDSIPGANGANIQGLKFDPAKAKQLLKEAGYGEGGKPFPAIKLTFRSPNETTQKWAEFVQGQLQANLGIKVDLEPMEWGKLLAESAKKTTLDMFLLGWSADYMDPQNFLSLLLHTKAPYNRYGYSNKEFDAILDKADVAPPGPARLGEYSKAEQIAVTDAAWIPATYPKSVRLLKPYVKGFQYSAMGELRYNTIEIVK